MTKREYEELHRVVKDKLGHQLHVGDLAIGYAYSNNVRIYKVMKLCPKKVVVARASQGTWTEYMYPDRLIKIKKNGISED
jgi:hypothetical protein